MRRFRVMMKARGHLILFVLEDKMKKSIFYLFQILSIGFMLVPVMAIGGTLTSQFNVQASLAGTCVLRTVDINFGTINIEPGQGSVAVNGNGTVWVTCTNGTPFRVGLSVGNMPDGTMRQMQIDGGERIYIPYQLYMDAAHTLYWGPTSPDLVTGVGTGVEGGRSVEATAFIPASAVLGNYRDVIVATLEY